MGLINTLKSWLGLRENTDDEGFVTATKNGRDWECSVTNLTQTFILY